MAARAALLALISGVAVAFVFGGLRTAGSAAFPIAFFVGSVAAGCSFAVAMGIFIVAMPRLEPRIAAFLALAFGAVVAFLVGYLLQPISRPV